MNSNELEQLARQLLSGELTVNAFVAAQTGDARTADVGDAQVDLDRERRCGFPEVVYGHGKTVAMLEKIFRALIAAKTDVLSTRISSEQADELILRFPNGIYNSVARTFRIPLATLARSASERISAGRVALITAGSSDLPVAEEARETLAWMGVETVFIRDVGVAGPHRLPAHLAELQDVDAVVVVAGMEGALPSVVGGYVACPVIGVPTSVGYGANFGGLSALLSMLNSCAANVTVVNIDAGFKGGYVAGLIAKRAAQHAFPSSPLAPRP